VDSPQEQLDAAERAEGLNPLSVTPLYLQASALETMGEPDQAREALDEALREEPESFVTLALLVDLEVRAGDLRAARARYSRASELNPLDTGLRELAARSRRPRGKPIPRGIRPSRSRSITRRAQAS
jgi:predicted Zn-dependent protease